MKNNSLFTIKCNKQKKTYTIRKYVNGKIVTKYRSIPQGTSYSESVKFWSQNDIKDFLKTDEYYIVK